MTEERKPKKMPRYKHPQGSVATSVLLPIPLRERLDREVGAQQFGGRKTNRSQYVVEILTEYFEDLDRRRRDHEVRQALARHGGEQ